MWIGFFLSSLPCAPRVALVLRIASCLSNTTAPHKPVWNDHDNEAHDYILHVGEVVEGARFHFTVLKLLGRGTFGQVG
jgi:hypothetical protein